MEDTNKTSPSIEDRHGNSVGSMPKIIFRRSPPGQYDHAPQGTLCVVNKHGMSAGALAKVDEEEAIYKQNSGDESSPVWIKI